MPNFKSSKGRGFSIVPAAITFGVIAAMVILVGQITLRPWAGTDNGFDTHLNYSTVSDDYSRSNVGRVGDSSGSPDGWRPTSEIQSDDTLAAWVGFGCASCHGIDGFGGEVGPNLQELVRDDFADKIRFGADGMPAFGEMDLTDEHIAELAAYLIEIGGPPPTPTPTPAPTSTPAPTPTLVA
ncbi:MAG: cytochrome c, partial [Chloroflexi bacterium]|nr:cytochrome c [Chloroflexota bacterium]